MDGQRWHQIAREKMAIGAYREAVELLRNAHQFDDSLPGVREDLALSLIHSGEFEEALGVYDSLVKTDLTIEIRILRAGLLLMMERPADAETGFQEVLQMDDQNTSALKGLADSYFRQSNFKKALEIYDQLIDMDPEDAFLWFSKAEALYRFQDHEASFDTIERAIALEHAPEFFAFKGDFFIRHDSYERALEQYRLAANLDPKNPEIRMRLGFIYRILERLKDALSEFDRAFTLDSNYIEALKNKVEILNLLNQPEAARAVQDNPADLENGLGLIDTYMDHGGYTRAAELLEILTDHHQSREIWTRLVACMIELKDFNRAKQALNHLKPFDENSYAEWSETLEKALE
ncbi:MAG: tetratricopeptide repeat protein [Candidatus Kariarchaeaceae archaeon]